MFSQLYKPFIAKIFATASSLVMSLVSLKLFSNYLTPAEFGIFAVASQALAYVPFLDGGVRTAVNSKLAGLENEDEKGKLLAFCQQFYSWFTVFVFLGLLTAMLLYWLTPNVRESNLPLGLFLALGTAAAVQIPISAQAGLLIALHAQNWYFWIMGAANLLTLGLLATAFHFNLRLWAFPLVTVTMALATWPVILHLVRERAPGFKAFDFHLDGEFWAALKKIRSSAFSSFQSQVAIFFLYSIDLVIVGMFCAPAETAAYVLLVRILSIIRGFIQSVGEVSWPYMARESAATNLWSARLMRFNSWLYGSAAGAIFITLLPFLTWYMGASWTAPRSLLVLLLLRFLIAGLQSPAGYFLMGRSEFKALARYNGRELVAAVLFSFLLVGWNSEGVAAGFLLATVFGTLFPIFHAYARAAGFQMGSILGAIWLRAAGAFAISTFVAWLLMMPLKDARLTLPVAAVATALGACAPFIHWRWQKLRASSTAG